MAQALRTFVLRDDSNAQAFWGFLKNNWRQMASAGKPLAVSVTEHRAQRSTQANKKYWATLNDIAENAWLDGRQYSSAAWHAYFAARFIGCEDLPGGGTTAISTTTLNVEEFNAYLERIMHFAATELGVELV
ncbi:recombination protein NinB [Cupriavidus metallidurans]|uniref:recombination protein NinB n=1 Tax=Cupriavidus metallidurans TaxID=119219 RepID=UPI0016453E15|nr:recombination protein NinB [Cupriavidus metallidurans]